MDVEIALLGGFRVSVGGVAIPDDAWGRRTAAALVKLLALSPERRLHREQVLDALWPGTSVTDAGPRLHKAAHFARRSLGERTSGVVLRGEIVLLLPDDVVEVDAARFEAAARAAIEKGDADAAAAVADTWAGELLPDDVYEPWAQEARDRLRILHADLLRQAGRWEALLQQDPADEEAHLSLARRMAKGGNVRGALRQLERLDRALRAELGTAPSQEAVRLRSALQAALGRGVGADGGSGRAGLVGRREAVAALGRAMVRTRAGRGTTMLVTGPTGVGKSALMSAAVRMAQEQDWRIGRGAASSVEGPWAYAAVLEALADLCRHHSTLLDGLDDAYRTEIDAALSGRELRWSGETAHQRLFIAAAELVRLAAAGHGLLLVIEDLHEADEASLRLVHYLARCAVDAPVMLLLSARATAGAPIPPVLAGLLARGVGTRLDLAPLSLDQAMELLAERYPDLTRSTAERLWTISGGLPFTLLESARMAAADPGPGRSAAGQGSVPLAAALATLPASTSTLVQRLAVLGMDASTDEVLALAERDPDGAFQDLDAAVDALLLVPGETGYRFRHDAVREAVLAGIRPHRRTALHRDIAHRLVALGAPPARVARHLISGGDPQAAVSHVVTAVGTLGALGAYRDALDLIDAVLDHSTGEERGHLLARRGDLLMATGSPDAMAAYRAAIPLTSGVENRLARARLARAACFAADFDTAAAAIEGLDLEGDAADGPLLVARGNLAFFTGDTEAAWEAASRARRDLSGTNDPWQYVDLVSLQGLIAHNRGEWFGRLRLEMRQTQDAPDLAVALFDAHLCVAEFLLYGPVPYPEVIEMARSLRARAQRFGALRGVAFATSLIGEAALLMGDLDLAEEELERSVDLHREVAAPAGEAHSLQRLAEVRLVQGDRAEAQRLLQRALPLARWSLIGLHLLQRIYGTMIVAAGDPVTARAVVDRAEATMGETDRCPFCDIMFAVPAAIACADVGDVEEARRRLAEADVLAAHWDGGAWAAAVMEARAHLMIAEGSEREAAGLFESAAQLFQAAGQPLDARRCQQALLSPAT